MLQLHLPFPLFRLQPALLMHYNRRLKGHALRSGLIFSIRQAKFTFRDIKQSRLVGVSYQ